MVDLTVEPRFIDVIKKLLRCEGVKYTTAIIDLQVTNLVINHDGAARKSIYFSNTLRPCYYHRQVI